LAAGSRDSRMQRLDCRDVIHFIHFGGDYTGTNSSDAERLVWQEIDTAFENCILTIAVIKANYIEPRQFLKNAGCARISARRYRETQRKGEHCFQR